jgi:hypothetical protein
MLTTVSPQNECVIELCTTHTHKHAACRPNRKHANLKLAELFSFYYIFIYVNHLSLSTFVFPPQLKNGAGILSKLAHKSTGMNSNTIYCRITFENEIEGLQFIKFLKNQMKYKNIFTATEASFLPNAPTQNRPPDSKLPPNAYSVKFHHRRQNSLVRVSCYQSRHRQNLILISSH